MMTDEQIAKLPKHRREWLEIWGNTFAPKKVMPGTCEACVFNEGEHASGCPREFSEFAYPGGEPI